jgi:hypothetical protein
MLKWIKRKLGIEALQAEVPQLNKEIKQLERQNVHLKHMLESHYTCMNNHFNELERLTTIDIDVSRTGSSIILTGVYKGKGYVRFFDLSDREFSEFVDITKDMTRNRVLRVRDQPPEFTGWFFRE